MIADCQSYKHKRYHRQTFRRRHHRKRLTANRQAVALPNHNENHYHLQRHIRRHNNNNQRALSENPTAEY